MHTIKVKRSNIIPQALLLFVVSPLKQIANSLLIASKSLLLLTLATLEEDFLVRFFPFVFTDFAMKGVL